MKDGVVKLTFVGDMLCQNPQLEMMRRNGENYDSVFCNIAKYFKESDYVIGNLETAVAPSQRLSHELMCFNAPLDFIRAMKNAGIDFVSVANNHIWDRGPKGVDETLESLRTVGLDTTGAYESKSDSDKIFVKEIGGVKFAIVACTYETNFGRPRERMTPDLEWKVDLLKKPPPYPHSFWFPIRRSISDLFSIAFKQKIGRIRAAFKSAKRIGYCPESVSPDEIGSLENEPYRARILAKIKRAKTLADFVIVLPHIGGQHNPSPGCYQEYTMQWIAKAGADMILAGHSHIPQKAFRMGDGPFVAYCLGDLVFSMVEDRYATGFQTNFSIILNVYIDGKQNNIVKADFIPCMVPEGTATPHSVFDLYRDEMDPSVRERLMIDNETIVRAVRGGVLPVPVQEYYEIPLSVPLV